MPDDRTLCPKRGRMFCAGYRGEGVCTADMRFCGEPTADGDIAAEYLRIWYERNRETWWDRNNWGIWGSAPDRAGVHADNFMLRLMGEMGRINAERQRQADERMKAAARR